MVRHGSISYGHSRTESQYRVIQASQNERYRGKFGLPKEKHEDVVRQSHRGHLSRDFLDAS